MSLSKVWAQVEALLSDNISVIAVRDKDHTTNRGDVLVAKSPYSKWKDYQSRIATKDELWHIMEENDTTAVAIVCGAVSGNIEVIDIDVKYKPGIDAILLKDIRSFFPELFSRLRIHRTPSTGYHIIYRCDKPVPGNQKLAGRMCSVDEINLQLSRGVKRTNKEANFLETRGEGGYILAPPSIGYSIHSEVPIPLISWEERCSLIRLCESYNEIIKVAPAPKPTKTEESWYDENPFEHFNRACDPVTLMDTFGWKYSHENAHYIWFTRPDKQRGVSLSWNKSNRIFYCFTSSTELQANRGYNPATIIAELQFKGNKSDTYRDLIRQGFGRLKKAVESRIVKQNTITGKSGPSNLSNEAKTMLQEAQISYVEEHPYGIFWAYNEDMKMTIDRQGLYRVAHGIGFRLYKELITRIEGIFITIKEERDFFDQVKEYIREEDADTYNDICNSYESFIQKAGAFTITRLRILDITLILQDGPDFAYKFYSNVYVYITRDGTTVNSYESVKGLIWSHKVLKRDWTTEAPQQFKYLEFLHYAIGHSPQLQKIIGYLSHDFKDENTGYIITLVEKCPDPKQGGGSGKNIFGNLLRHTTTVCTIGGEQIQYNEKFLQAWNEERIFFIADAPKKFNFLFLKELSTGYGIVKKLYKNEQSLSPNDMPKILVNTNYSYDVSDGGLKRRILPLEFTDFFTKCGGVDVHFKCMFPTSTGPGGWDAGDWSGFDHYIALCLRDYFQANGRILPSELSDSGWEKQFHQNFSEATAKFIEDNITQWRADKFTDNDTFSKAYSEFCSVNHVHYKASSMMLNRALESYCDKYGIGFNKDHVIKENSVSKRGRLFD